MLLRLLNKRLLQETVELSSTVLHNLVHTSSIRYFTARQVPSKHGAVVYNRNVTHTVCRARLQVERLIRMIPLSLTNIREEVFIIFFGRLVDLRNIERPLWALTLRERQAVIHRLGFLNLCVASTTVHSPLCCFLTHSVRGVYRWNPMRPDGAFRFDLSITDHRRMAAALVHLAVTEPGENWGTALRSWQSRAWFARQTVNSVCVLLLCGTLAEDEALDERDNWELPASWVKSIPTKGILTLTYTSTR